MKRRFSFAFVLSVLALPTVLSAAASGCGDDTTADDGVKPPSLRPGDVCTTPQPNLVKVRFSPAQVFLPPCEGDACTARKVKVIVAPDVCAETPVSFSSSDEAALPAPAADKVTLYKSEIEIDLAGAKKPGRYTVTASVSNGAGADVTGALDVVVLDPKVPTCAGTAETPSLKGGDLLLGEGELAGASIGLQEGADKPNTGSYLWSVAPFAADLSCGSMDLPAGHIALGPAITFGPEDKKFQREIPMSIPINPALMPAKARMRHLRVLYSGPAFKKPRVVAIADPHLVEIGGQWALSFKAPRLGTYQAVIKEDAGSKKFKRRITYRAVTGVSMGGMGSSMFGLRHHDRFDVVAPLGGPAVWSWLLHYIENHHLAGFRPIAPGTQLADIPLTKTACSSDADCAADEACLGVTVDHQGGCTLLLPPTDPYEHTQTFNNWWAEYPRNGTGGGFPRDEYAQIFRDLALLMGNPNGDNLAPGGENLPPGVPPDDPSVVGDHPNGECSVWVDPIGEAPDYAKQQEIAQNCPAERCSHPLTLANYYDDEFNPDGAFPVITVCDGSPTSEDETPWANAWKAGPNQYPLEVALAVDYNGNGVRDELEPLIKSGHEPFTDSGPDGKLSVDEPGYQLGVNEDPAGDDYQIQYNPGGTEQDYRFEPGEPFKDVGMDGIAGTLQQPAGGWQQPGDGFDVGEGDGAFNASRGLNRMWDYDPAAVIRRQAKNVPGGELDDAALQRVDLWTDGGLRDIFNFHVAANTLVGAMASRDRDTAYYTGFAQLPGFDPSTPNQYTPALMPWEDVPGSVLVRYGKIDPTAADIENGSGQHVGTVDEIASRLQSALYFIGSRWQAPELRSVVKVSNDNPAPGAPLCEIDGACTFEFTDSRGRSGPVTVNLPPGYAHAEQQDRRYPVIFMLHGYGQTPEDLGAAIIFISNWMNNPGESASSRMPKAILVYVDGRCRTDNGKAECIRGNFFTDSAREDGMQADAWWLELMDEVDQKFRTLPPTEVEWEE